MLQKRDYVKFLNELLALEFEMEKVGRLLHRLIKKPQAQKLLNTLIADEQRHQKLVQGMIDLVKG